MSKIIIEKPIDPDTGIFHHDEGIGLRLANIHLDTMEVSLVNTISPIAHGEKPSQGGQKQV